MRTIPEMLSTVARQHATRPAVIEGATSVTYAELARRIGSLALELHERGVRPRDRVALLLPNGLSFVESYFAVATLGAVVVPLNDQYQQNELRLFLRECAVSLLVTASDRESLCQEVLAGLERPCTLIRLDAHRTVPGASDGILAALAPGIRPERDPVMIQFSSGSTGRPKRIARTHANLLFELDSLVRTMGFSSEDRFLGVAPFSHVNGLMRSMLASLRVGAALYPLPAFDRQAVVDAVQRNELTVFIAVPFMFSVLAKSSFDRRPDLSSLRLCISASAAMPKRLNEQFRESFGFYVRQLYGSTETGTISVNLSPDIESSLESVGRPISGVDVKVVAEDGHMLRAGETGEFAVRSPAAIERYEGGQAPDGAFRDGFFFTGDIGRSDGAGLLYLLGRKTSFINKGGYKIDPHEIEELLQSHPAVEEVAVVGVTTSYGDERVKAVVVARAPCSEGELVEFCRGKIARFKIPSLIEFRDELPRSPAGKIRRGLLIQLQPEA
jgi:long-chain acyl-CoA synthetase